MEDIDLGNGQKLTTIEMEQLRYEEPFASSPINDAPISRENDDSDEEAAAPSKRAEPAPPAMQATARLEAQATPIINQQPDQQNAYYNHFHKQTNSYGANDGKDGNNNDNDGDGASSSSDGTSPGPSTLVTFLLILIFAILIMLPSLILYWTKSFEWYNIIIKKSSSKGLNLYMEFFRWSVFLATAFCGYILLDWLVGTLPSTIVRFCQWAGISVSKKTRRRIGYLQAIRPYVTNALFLVFVLWIGSLLIYPTTLFGAKIASAANGASSPPPASSSSTPSPTSTTTAPLPELPKTFQYFFERSLIVLCVFTAVIAVEKYLIEAVAVNFHRMAFSKRIREINYRFEVLSILHRAATTSTAPRIITGTRGSPLSRMQSRLRQPNDDGTSASILITSMERARNVAHNVFVNICPPNRPFILPDDLLPFFPADEISTVFKAFDANQNGEISKAEFEEAILDMYQQRENMQESLQNNNRIVKKLDTVLITVGVLIATVLCAPFYDLGLAKAWAIFGLVLTVFGFMFQKAGQTFFESLLFIFVEHAFDVGDRVTIDGTNLVVTKIDIFTTTFVQWDGQIMYSPNASLSSKNIYNVRRSGCQSDTIDLNVGAGTTTNALWELKNRLVEFVKNEPRDYTGYIDITNFEVIDAKKMKIQLIVQYRSNFQNVALRNARKVKFTSKLKDLVAASGIEYVG